MTVTIYSNTIIASNPSESDPEFDSITLNLPDGNAAGITATGQSGSGLGARPHIFEIGSGVSLADDGGALDFYSRVGSGFGTSFEYRFRGGDSSTNDNDVFFYDGHITHGQGWRAVVAPFTYPGTGANAPTEVVASNGITRLSFDNGDHISTKLVIGHDYAEGTNVYPQIHMAPTTAMSAGEVVVWEFSYVVARGNQGDSSTGSANIITMTYTADGTELAGDHLIVEAADVDAFDALEPNSMIYAHCSRGGLGDTYGSPVYGDATNIHYLSDRETTRNRVYPFT
ncbi:hypothetical protein V5T82_07320 [Magnetovibrio sp. PR-2]|uniref:hypothetical protein n=1 Tax=Magnetovibrio sp. PR-2 TaxID=3120356 RepID=UPI002FCE2587